MAKIPLLLAVQLCLCCASAAEPTPTQGLASWYGEEHRGKLMANGKRFNPDRLTAASWFYPLGTKVRVTLAEGNRTERSVVVTITDRGPAKDLVSDGRIIDLTHAALRRLANPERGLVTINVEAVRQQRVATNVRLASASAPYVSRAKEVERLSTGAAARK